MLRWRLFFGILISSAVVGLCVLDVFLEGKTQIPGIALFPLLVVLIILACREMLHLANRSHVYPVPYVTYAGCLFIAASGWGAFVLQHNTPTVPVAPTT
ncbi:MAG: hypothetical protein Q4D38_07490, partial [Planctomycetia bacterium]|nr:hypothetical protein [Planctomycetia bacterium]